MPGGIGFKLQGGGMDEFVLDDVVNWVQRNTELMIPQARRQNFLCNLCGNQLGLEPVVQVTNCRGRNFEFVLICVSCAKNGWPIQ